MKQDVVEYMTDSFIDFKGVEHKIIACALSQTPETSEDGYDLCVGWTDESGTIDSDDTDYGKIYRVVTIGVAICNPIDAYDIEVGKKTAYNKALHDPKCPTIYTKSKGVASKTLVESFMKQEINFIKENPERVIKGYNQRKERFDRKENIRKEIKSLSEKELYVANLAQEGVDVVKCAELAKKAKIAGIGLNE